MSWRPGPGIAGYEDAALIGEGGFATVYRARQPAFNRLVALKVLSKVRLDEQTLRRFDRERAAIGSLSGHPNIVTVYESGLTHDGVPYLAMEYLPGGSLADRLAREGPLPWAQVARIGVRLAGALESAHQAGILHRDLKPENVLLSGFGEPLLTDFGIARVLGSPETRTVNQAVSIAHAAPEVLNGEPFTRQSDVYSLGSTLFTLLWGRPPFLRDDDELLLSLLVRVSREPLPDLRQRGVPGPLCTAIERAMAKDPGGRQVSALDLATELQDAEAAAGRVPTVPLVVGEAPSPERPADPVAGVRTAPVPPTPVAPPVETPVETPARPRRRRRWALLALPLVLAAVALAAVQAGREPSGSTAGPTTAPSTVPVETTPTSTSTSTTLVRAVEIPGGTAPLAAGRYVASGFATPFEFTLPEGWRATRPPGEDFLELTRTDGDGTATVTFLRVSEVFDAQRAPVTAAETTAALQDPPGDLVRWVRSHPRLSVGDAAAVTKGALSGIAVDAQPTLGYSQENCLRAVPGRRCVLLFMTKADIFYVVSEGYRMRLHVLRVGDDTLVAAIEAPVAGFEGLATEAERVLATLGPKR